MGATPAEQWATLNAKLLAAQQAYYGEDASPLSDAEYDEALRELQALEDANPELRSAESATQVVGAARFTTF